MYSLRKIETIDPCIPFFTGETSIFIPHPLSLPSFSSVFEQEDELSFAFDLLNPIPNPCFFDFASPFDSVADLVQFERTPLFSSYKRVQKRVHNELYLKSLCDRVSALELSFDRLVNAKDGYDRKYSWTAEIKDGAERKYKWTAEIKGEKSHRHKKKTEEEYHDSDREVEKNYKWTAEIKGRGRHGHPISKTCTFKASTGGESSEVGKEKKKKKEKKAVKEVEIEEADDHGAVVLRQAFAKRVGVNGNKGKKKELSPQDAALMIQITFRAYLIRRSQALRALRELAIAKTKLKEIRALFNNFSYRRCIARDAEERQRYSEKIIVLLLTVDAIEGVDLTVRPAKKSMVDELEAMLDVVDPQPPGKLLTRRRTFDMPNGVFQKEIAAGVAKVVELIDQDVSETNSVEA
ncbi:hypothetical protein RJ641_033345 [Dillenia turbinata]|uniref:BAG domain-containing protein n=1 Tax=Dillenia turbinata TaxID=194707 RepID=A0AAN8ZJB1_9MAGN